MTELEALRVRHSVRNYTDQKIEPDKIAQLKEMIDQCNTEGNLHLQLCEDAANTYNRLLNKPMGLGSAPSVIACIGPDDETVEERVGYYGQKIVLYAQQLGLNTCWVGIFNKNGIPVQPKKGEKLVISIAIGYGVNGGHDRKSKSLEEVTSGKKEQPDWFKAGMEAALLAPTAMNQQKFEIKLNEDDTVTFINKGGPYAKVDIGIVKYNFEVGAGKQ